MRPNHVTIPVTDIDRAVDFYLRLSQIVAAPDGALQTLGIDVEGSRITAIYMVLNPEKLQRVAF